MTPSCSAHLAIAAVALGGAVGCEAFPASMSRISRGTSASEAVVDAGREASTDETNRPAPEWSPDGGTGIPGPLRHEQGAAECGSCHATIYQQWRQAMHSHALVSPTMIAQTNQVVSGPLAPLGRNADPELLKVCINCHSPTVGAVAKGASLPQPDATGAREGVTCVTCHQFNGESVLGSGAFSTGYMRGFISGDTYLGNTDSPVENKAHKSQKGKAFADSNQLCKNCHEVWLDLNQNGVEEKGIDLILQTTWSEYKDYKAFGGKETCISCHMPPTAGVTRAADGAAIPNEQFVEAPPRVVHDHSFVGTDHLLDSPEQTRAQAQKREALLKAAATLKFDRLSITSTTNEETGVTTVGLDVYVGNVGAGHNLPTGFAFARQMWIELTATTALRTLTFASGVIARPSDDLCDGATLRDTAANPMALFVRGCLFVDGPLVNFQQKLVTKLLPVPQTRFLNQDTITAAVQDPFLGTETFLQYLHGGAVARKRTEGEGELGLLLPGEYRRVHYDVLSPGFGGRITARLLFRALPPYFLRALAQGKSAVPFGDIGAAIDHLEVVEMARDEVRF